MGKHKQYKRGYKDGRFEEGIVIYSLLRQRLDNAEEQYRITQHPYWNGIADGLAAAIHDVLGGDENGRVR